MSSRKAAAPDYALVQRIASTFVHDFNNLFQTALGNLDLLSGRIQNPSDAELVAESIESLERAIALTRRLNLAGNKYPDRFETFDVDGAIAQVLPRLNEKRGARRAVSVAGTPAGVQCRLGPGDLEEVLAALILDGPAALARGRVSIEISADQFAAPADDLPAGGYVRIAVSATDVEPMAAPAGMLPGLEVLDGVGLVLTQAFCAQIGGACRVEKASDEAMRVDLFLPCDRAAAGDKRADLPAAEAQSAAAGMTDVPEPKALVVDDNAAIADLLVRHLAGTGFRPVVANDVDGALTAFADGADFGLLVCDLDLGRGAGGLDFAREARALRPALPIMFISGQVAQPRGEGEFDYENTCFLRKPFRAKQFRTALQELLDS